jgi:hypothetical protein
MTNIPQPCTSISLGSSKSTAYAGDIITFYITVGPATQSFPVEIRDQNNSQIGFCTTSGGTCTANWNTTGLSSGTYSISASTTGCPITSTVPITILPACTSIDIATNKTSFYIGETVTFTITVQPYAQQYPIDVRNQYGTLIGICTTSGGTCTVNWNTTGLSPGPYSISATANGCSLSSTIPITLLPACTSINLYINKTSAYVGGTLTFTVVAQPYAQPYPIEIKDQNNNIIETCMTSEGTCIVDWNTTGLSTGTYNISAKTYGCNLESPIPVTLLPICASIDISASKPFAYVGEMIIFMITTQPSTQSYPIEVRYQGNNSIGTGMTSGGVCTVNWDTTGLTAGIYHISTTAYGCSLASPIPITLLPICILVNIIPDKTSVTIGDSITFNVNVSPILQPFNIQLADQYNNYIGNTCTTSNGICSITWDTTGFLSKSYIITAIVVDNDAGECVSNPVSIILQLPLLERGSTIAIGIVGIMGLGLMIRSKRKKPKK